MAGTALLSFTRTRPWNALLHLCYFTHQQVYDCECNSAWINTDWRKRSPWPSKTSSFMSAVSETLCPIDLAQMASFYMHGRRRGNILNYFPHAFFFFFTSFPLSNLIHWCVGWKCVPVSGFPTVRPLSQLLWFFYNDLGHRNTSSAVCLLGQDIDLQGFLILTSRLQRNSIIKFCP